ncbi:MAG: type II secretion system protein, partial [Bacilli bacterium]|nr:type II secretion system protein [Bacilli bacterium]
MRRMNKKGFSTIELIVSFVIVSFVAIAIFRTVVVLMDKVNFYQSESEMTIINGNIINSIQKDLRYRKLYGISACGTDCYDITYQDLAVRRLKVDSANNSIQYGGFTDKLPSDVKITGALQL